MSWLYNYLYHEFNCFFKFIVLVHIFLEIMCQFETYWVKYKIAGVLLYTYIEYRYIYKQLLVIHCLPTKSTYNLKQDD